MHKIKKIGPLVAAVLLACASAAHADALLDESIYGSLVGTNNATVNGVTFTANGGDFVTKAVGDANGLGITQDGSRSEIDIGESLTMSFEERVISDFTLALLYNGPEYGDYREIANVAVYNGASLLGNYTLQVGDDGTYPGAAWTGFGMVSNLSAADDAGGGAWLISGNPFGNVAATKLVFSALASGACQSVGACNNQSDYVLTSVNAVPEPGTYALMAAGLGAVGFIARRRRQRA